MGKHSLVGRERKRRIARRRELRLRGIVPCRVQRVYRVDLERTTVPAWAERRAVKGLSQSPTHVWLTRMAARRLEHEARLLGVATLTEAEYRLCPVCEQILLSEDAALRRALDESCMTGRQLPCGDGCLERARKRKER